MFEFIKKRKLAKVTRLALKDGILSDVEKKNLANEADRLGLNHNEINRVRLNDYQNRVGPILEKVINARRMRVVELERIYEIADNLGIEPELSSDLDKCWQLRCWDDGETLDLPTCASSILLKSGEFCFLEIPATWLQLKTIKTRVGSTGFSTSFKIMKGVRYRIGNVKPHYASHDELVTISDGVLVITNKRTVFKGVRKSFNVNHGKLLDISVYSDGIELTKGSGNNDIVRTSHLSADYAAMLVQHFS